MGEVAWFVAGLTWGLVIWQWVEYVIPLWRRRRDTEGGSE